ncbi:MAG: hypothetical protein WCJ30_18995 [Deltaproteobacteria bacterium]
MWNVVDRRSERSGQLEGALHLLLRSQRQRGELDLIVLATYEGLVIAHDGPQNLCEEIAAYAPLLARGAPVAIDPKRIRGLSVHAFMVGRQELLLATRGGTDTGVTDTLAMASIKGATRILRG